MGKPYIVLSIFGKGAEILIDDEDEMNVTVKCPYCGRPTKVGDTAMMCGVVYCPACSEDCIAEVMHDREFDYERYLHHDYQPYGVDRKKTNKKT